MKEERYARLLVKIYRELLYHCQEFNSVGDYNTISSCCMKHKARLAKEIMRLLPEKEIEEMANKIENAGYDTYSVDIFMDK